MSGKPAEAAQRLLRDGHVTEPPVPVEHLARLCEARIEYEPFDGDISGMLFRDDTRRIIGVNASHARSRQRFTIAHELGHLLLHKGRPVIVDKAIRIEGTGRMNMRSHASSLATDKEEIEANAFAAELLLPPEQVRSAALTILRERKKIGDEELVAELAKLFRVSGQSIQYRLAKLGILSTHALFD